MTRGALIFAFNNEKTDYVGMAAWCAKNIRQHLDLPTAVVTDCTDAAKLSNFDQVIYSSAEAGGTRFFEDYNSTVTWNNASRVNAYVLSPWDETLVLDADYVVSSSQLNRLWNIDNDFMCHTDAFNMATGEYLAELNVFGEHRLPMSWATVMMFRRSNTAQFIFDCMQMIHDNWQHYRDLYGIHNKNYRNDFALSIAIGIVSGHTGHVGRIPWALASVLPEATLSSFPLGYTVEYTDASGQRKYIDFRGMDFHAMGKAHLEKIIEAS